MMARHFAKTCAFMSLTDGPEVEFDIWITFTVAPGCAAVLYGDYPSPAEPATVDIVEVEAHDPKNGINHKLPAFIADALINDTIREWLLSEAAEAAIAAADEAADHRREDARDAA